MFTGSIIKHIFQKKMCFEYIHTYKSIKKMCLPSMKCMLYHGNYASAPYFLFLLFVHLSNYRKVIESVHLSSHSTIHPSKYKKNPPNYPFIWLFPLSSLWPVTMLCLCCASTFPAASIRILSVVYLSWTSFMCLIDPQSSETIDFYL